MTEQLLTVNQVAERLQIHPISVRLKIKDGTIKSIRVGKKSIRIRPEDLEKYISTGG